MKLLLHSPIGPLLATYDEEQLESLHFWRVGDHPPAGTRDEPARNDHFGRHLADELAEYFSGDRQRFDIAMRPARTPFGAMVREALLAIPYGEVRSYGQLAAALERPGGARAVGQANAHNPFPILVPCHRVVAADGSLGGYAGDWGEGEGLAIKRWLLRHENPHS